VATIATINSILPPISPLPTVISPVTITPIERGPIEPIDPGPLKPGGGH
jgi:hypothetical protein